MKRLLLISNSTNPGEPYLDYPKQNIKQFLGDKPLRIVFIPYAAVTFSYDEYERKVNERFKEIGHQVRSIHHFDDPVKGIEEAEAIVVGGGNTWKLVRTVHDNKLMDVIRQKVLSGVPYVGWSAGSNLACPTLRTTNDMPIIDPKTFDTLNLISFQINPHYLDDNPANHGGETREMRIQEFIEQNQDVTVAGLREGTMFLVEGNKIELIGQRPVRIFHYGKEAHEFTNKDDLSFLMP